MHYFTATRFDLITMIISVVIDRPINFSELHVPTIQIYSFLLRNVFILYVKHSVDFLLFIRARVLIRPILLVFRIKFIYSFILWHPFSNLPIFFVGNMFTLVLFFLWLIYSRRNRSGYGIFVISFICFIQDSQCVNQKLFYRFPLLE